MRSSVSRTKCKLALITCVSIAMLWSNNPQPSGLTVFNGEADIYTAADLKALLSSEQRSTNKDADGETRARVMDSYGKLPLSFEDNKTCACGGG
jgi:hypothetical protein